MLKKTAILVLVLVASFGIMMLSTRSSTFQVRDSLLIAEEPAKIWQVLADVEQWPQWWPGIETARLSSSWAEGVGLELVLTGNPAVGPAQVERYRSGAELTFTRDGVLGSRVGNRLCLEPQSEAGRVSVESVVLGPQAFLARFTGDEAFSDYHRRLLAGLAERIRQVDFSRAQTESFDGR